MTIRTGEDILIWRRRLCIALYGGIVLEEALDLSSDRILNEWMNTNISRTDYIRYIKVFRNFHKRLIILIRSKLQHSMQREEECWCAKIMNYVRIKHLCNLLAFSTNLRTETEQWDDMFNSKLRQFYQTRKNTCKLRAFTQSTKIANHVLHTNTHIHTYQCIYAQHPKRLSIRTMIQHPREELSNLL